MHREKGLSIHNKYLSKIYLNIAKSYFRINRINETKEYFEKLLSFEDDYKKKNIDKEFDDFLTMLRHDPGL